MFSSLTFPAALLGAAVRVLRTAGGRRVLQLVLLVGGLFTLGFLCGEQAHAADGTPAPGMVTSARSVVTGQQGPTGAVRTVAARIAAPVRRAGERAVTPVRRIGVQAVPVQGIGGRAVTPVREVVAAVSRSVGSGVAGQAVEEPRPSPPSPPVPDLPRAPEPKSTASRPQGHGGAVVAAQAEQTQRHAAARGLTSVGAPAPVTSYGPEAAAASQRTARTTARHGTAAVGAPGCPSPSGEPAGVPGKQAADGTVSRHDDAHAVTLGHRAPLRLTPGITAYGDVPRTRERHRDIPVFPG